MKFVTFIYFQCVINYITSEVTSCIYIAEKTFSINNVYGLFLLAKVRLILEPTSAPHMPSHTKIKTIAKFNQIVSEIQIFAHLRHF